MSSQEEFQSQVIQRCLKQCHTTFSTKQELSEAQCHFLRLHESNLTRQFYTRIALVSGLSSFVILGGRLIPSHSRLLIATKVVFVYGLCGIGGFV